MKTSKQNGIGRRFATGDYVHVSYAVGLSPFVGRGYAQRPTGSTTRVMLLWVYSVYTNVWERADAGAFVDVPTSSVSRCKDPRPADVGDGVPAYKSDGKPNVIRAMVDAGVKGLTLKRVARGFCESFPGESAYEFSARQITAQSDKAVRVEMDGGWDLWLPKSKATVTVVLFEDGRSSVVCAVPYWLAYKKRLASHQYGPLNAEG